MIGQQAQGFGYYYVGIGAGATAASIVWAVFVIPAALVRRHRRTDADIERILGQFAPEPRTIREMRRRPDTAPAPHQPAAPTEPDVDVKVTPVSRTLGRHTIRVRYSAGVAVRAATMLAWLVWVRYTAAVAWLVGLVADMPAFTAHDPFPRPKHHY